MAKPRATIVSLTMARKSKCAGRHIGLSPTGFVALDSAASSFIAARHARVYLQSLPLRSVLGKENTKLVAATRAWGSVDALSLVFPR